MFGSGHPAYKELLLFESAELEPSRAAAVESHLQECEACRAQLAKVGAVRSAVAEANEPLFHQPAGRPFRRAAWRPATAGLVAVALVAYLLTDGTPEARADELLERATATQGGGAQRARPLVLRSKDRECFARSHGGPKLAATAADAVFCDAVASTFQSAGWSGSDLLSPKKFQQWRGGLANKEDSVTESGQIAEITTSAAESPVRLASLKLRTSDYRAVGARYELAVGPEKRAAIDVSETLRIPDAVLADSAPKPPARTPAPKAPAPPPLEALEARVRLTLHALAVDGDVRLAVDRESPGLRVWGVIGDSEIRQAVHDVFGSEERVEISLVTEQEMQEAETEPRIPWIAAQGDSLPLAHDELDRIFRNDPEGRQRMLNDLDAATRELVGATRARDALLGLSDRLEPSPVFADLKRAAADFKPRIAALLMRISSDLEPLIGPLRPGSGDELTGEEAQELYVLVHQTVFLSSSSDSPAPLPQTLARIAELLK